MSGQKAAVSLPSSNRKHAMIYDRGSTSSQKNNWSRDDAERVGRELAERYGYTWELRQEIKSGETLEERPVIMGILKEIEAGKVQAIICQDFTRLSRDEDGIDGRMIRRICQDNGCRVITPQKAYDFDQDADHDMSDFELLVGKIQKRQNIRGLMRGLQERARQGYLVGWRAKVGYRRVPSREMYKGKVIYWPEIIPEEANLVREAFHSLLREGNPNAAVRWLNRNGHLLPLKYDKCRQKSKGQFREWRRKDLISFVTDEIYTGWLVYGRNCKSRFMKEFEEQRHFYPELRIIDQDTFDRCQELLAGRRGRVPAKAQPYPFSGLIRCGCGSGMVGRLVVVRRNGHIWNQKMYDCSRRDIRGVGNCAKGKTIMETVTARTVLPFVAQHLMEIGTRLRPALDSAAREMSASGLHDRLIAEAQAELAETEKQADNLARGVAAGILAEGQARRISQELAEKKERLRGKMAGLQQKLDIEAEFRYAIERLDGDIEQELWTMFNHAPGSLGQLLRFILEPASIELRAFGPSRNRQAELLGYRFTQTFQDLLYCGNGSDTTLPGP